MQLEITKAIHAAVKGGQAIMEVYKKDFSVEYKDDKSPLTEADRAADRVIKKELGEQYPILSEEGKAIDYNERKTWDRFWMVDPLDGTKEFIKKNDEFTVNIALIENEKPVLGVVYVPATQQLFFADNEIGAYVITIDDHTDTTDISRLRAASKKLQAGQRPSVYTIVASRSHLSPETQVFIDQCKKEQGQIETISKGSSLKLCLVAEGNADVYPRIAPTMEWDTAAAHAIAKFAGCSVLNFDTGEELIYNKPNLLNPYFIVRNER